MERPQWLLQRSPRCCCPPLLSPTLALAPTRHRRLSLRRPMAAAASSTPDVVEDGAWQLTARERRQLKNERRESLTAAAVSWREEVEERVMHKPKKREKVSRKEELNLDNLARLGPQWWVVRVSRVTTGQDTAKRLARVLARKYPDMDFKVYFPAVRVKRKLKNGSCSTKSNPLFPGCVFLYCVLNKELHDFVRECYGVGGFLGTKKGNTWQQINKPKPVAASEMEGIFHQAKQEQEKNDKSFEEEQADGTSHGGGENINSLADSNGKAKLKADTRPKRRSDKGSETTEAISLSEKDHVLAPGSHVRILCGPFTNYVGHLKKLDRKSGKATIRILMFGKETFVEVEPNEIIVETT